MPEAKARENNDTVLSIFTSKITFLKPKQNKHNGSQIGIRYSGKTLYVKYEGLTPFGIQENYDKEGNFYGVTMQINLTDDYSQKSQELDGFFLRKLFIRINGV